MNHVEAQSGKKLDDLVKQKAIKPQVAKQAQEALNAVLEQLPRPVREFELGHEDEIGRLVEELDKKEQEECEEKKEE